MSAASHTQSRLTMKHIGVLSLVIVSSLPLGCSRKQGDASPVKVEVQRVEHFLHGVGSVRVHLAVARPVHRLRRPHDAGGAVELGHEAVQPVAAHAASFSSALAPGTSVRISKIEIAGRKRMNRKNRVRKRPIVPRNIDQSNGVPR